jgi:DNA polymerase-3 subunit epsilon
MREIVLDTETTGTEARRGDRIVEIGCVELINHCPTGRSYHTYLNPERPVAEGAVAVHGLTDAFLADKPLFKDVAEAFTAFIGDARLVIHNAPFDVGFLDMEFGRLGLPPIEPRRVVDTLVMARRKHPGASNSLDALAGRYGVDLSRRVKHGALLDAEILAEVYIELIGGRQAGFALGMPGRGPHAGAAHAGGVSGAAEAGALQAGAMGAARRRPGPRPSRLTLMERARHAEFMAALAKASGGKPLLWEAYAAPEAGEGESRPADPPA